MIKNNLIKGLAILVPVAVVLTISACGGDDSSGGTSYSGPGSKWDVTLNVDNTFVITRAASVSDPIDMTVNGTYSSLTTGFLKLTVGSSTGASAPAAGDVAYALDVPGYAFILKPLGSGSQIVPMVKAGTCPVSNMAANWVMVKSNNLANSGTADFFGTFNYDAATGTPSLPTKYSLMDMVNSVGPGTITAGTCASGIMTVSEAVMYLTDNGGAVVHANAGTPADTTDDEFIFALTQKAISGSGTDGNYAGLLFDKSNVGSEVSPVSVTCASNVCTGVGYTDVETGTTGGGSVTINLTSIDSPSNGFATGTIDNGGLAVAIACMIDVNASGSGKKVMSCVGQSPGGDATKLFNVLLATKS